MSLSAAGSLSSWASASFDCASDALRQEEAERCEVWSIIVIGLSLAGLAFSLNLAGDKAIFRASLLLLGAVSIWAWYRSRSVERYTAGVFRVFGWTSAAVSLSITQYLGVFSPTPTIITLGISFFGVGLDRRSAYGISLCATLGYVAITLMVMFDVLPPSQVVGAHGLDAWTQVYFLIMVPLVYVTTLWMARVSRRTMEQAISRSQRALLLASERAAQLAEVQRELEVVRNAGEGALGYYSGKAAAGYELAEVIGRGAMGEIYATNGSHRPDVAVKVLRIDRVGPQLLDRFIREGELASRVQSEHIVRVLKLGKLYDGAPFIAMERLNGEDLAAILRKRGRLSLRQTVALMQEICRGLSAAHGAGVIHRDLKPDNLFRARCGNHRVWKILDFGVSKLSGAASTLTQALVVGTPGYMSPEQAGGEDVDVRADIFALGALCYRALTGTPPFSGKNTPQILFEVAYAQPAQPSRLVERIPEHVEHVLAIALCKERDMRFASADEFCRAFSSAAGQLLAPRYISRGQKIVAQHAWGTKRQC